METKANYILIGLFTIAGIVGIVAFFLWLARIELDRQFAYYDVRFTSVAGLSAASDVRFSGLPVGQVVDVRLSPDRDGTITVRLEVAADTPVRTDSVATIESQGVTGVSFVGISPGTPEEQLIVAGPGEVPEITAGRSVLQSLTEDAPELVTETLLIVQSLGDLFRGENEGRLERILLNVEDASDAFASTLEGFSDIAGTVADFTGQIDRFNATLDGLTTELSVVLRTANDTLASIDGLAVQATGAVQAGAETLDVVQGAVAEARRFVAEDLAATTTSLRDTLEQVRTELATLGANASGLMVTLDTTGATATARLQEMEATVARLDAALGTLDAAGIAVTGAATRIDGLIVAEGAPLLAETRAAVADARAAIAAVEAATTTDLPALMADLRAAAESARTTIDGVGAELSAAGGDISGLVADAGSTLAQVTDTFARANATLAAIDGALDVGTRTLVSAESAFAGADALINDDMGALIGDLRVTVDSLNAAVDTVAADLPVISADVRAASEAASEAFAQLEVLIAGAAPGVQAFTVSGLPLYTRLAEESRALIANLNSLTQRISRSPTQFLLDREVPEFRR